MSVYKKESSTLFKNALSSILDQMKLPEEFVLVEDGYLTQELQNVVNSFKILFEKKGIKFRILINEHNEGLGLSLRKGIEACQFEWVARFDSDDVNDKSRMKDTFEYISNNPDIAIVGSYISEFIDDIKEVQSFRRVPLSDAEIRKNVKWRNPFNHMSVTLNREAVISAGNYQDVPYFEDYDLWVRVIDQNKKVGNIGKNLVYAHIDRKFYLKRGGYQYFKKEIGFQKKLYAHKIIPNYVFLFNILTRGCFRLLPKSFVKLIYSLARKK